MAKKSEKKKSGQETAKENETVESLRTPQKK